MRIAIDALGGDLAPAEPVKAALESAARHPDYTVLLVGERATVEPALAAAAGGGGAPGNIELVDSEGFIAMHAEPVSALRKQPGASIPVCVGLLKSGGADAMVSAGNTGAVVAGSMFGLNRLPGVRRPGIAAVFPALTEAGRCLLIDVGANVSCKPVNLYQYGVMGSAFARLILGVATPKVGLLSIGEEEGKGNLLVKETRRLFAERGGAFEFRGNVEGRDIFGGDVDVVVCEGFVGNAILKVAEGVSETLLRTIKAEVQQMVAGGDGGDGQALGAALKRLKQKTDYAEAGGAPLLGMTGHVQICHGRSDGRAIANAVTSAARMVEQKINERITEALHAHAT